jgi:hypothetical protein
MASKQRIKRPTLKRTAPDRRFSGAFRPPEPGASSPEAPNAKREPKSDKKAGVPYEAVNGAYRLVDEYLRQGQKMAEELWLPQSNGGVPDVGKVVERFLRSAGDMGTAWFEMMNQWAAGPPEHAAPNGGTGPFAAGRRATHAAGANGATAAGALSTALSVSVESSRKFRITVDVFGAHAGTDVELVALKAADGSAALIDDIVAERDPTEGRITLSVRVPKGQPAAVYNGILVEKRTQRPRGTVSLVLE